MSAQPGIAADRFAREIVRFLEIVPGALAAAECQTVGWQPIVAVHMLQSVLPTLSDPFRCSARESSDDTPFC